MIRRCPLSYEDLADNEDLYSIQGLKKLSTRLKSLKPFAYSLEESRREAQRLATKISIQGVQSKLSVTLSLHDREFLIVDQGGKYILKPQAVDYPELPENEDLTMDLASIAGFEVPWHGLIHTIDHRLAYVIRRFDRVGQKGKIPLEDFSQLIGASRSTKYLGSIERVAEVIEEYCSFPKVELVKLYRLLLFSFLVGNEDLHLKNLSLITNQDKVSLSPCYDLLNSTIALASPQEEMALELNGKKHGFDRTDLIDYLGLEVCDILPAQAEKEAQRLLSKMDAWQTHIEKSFLSEKGKAQYKELIEERAQRLR